MLPLVLFWRWVFKGEVLFWGTTLLQFWPWRYLAKASILQGEWPLWNPLLGNGAPLLANLQTALFYPFNLLYLFLPVEHGLTFSIVLHLALAGLFMYFYTRYLGLQSFPATLSALTYMFSGYLVGRSQFVSMVNAAAWFPLLLLISDKLATRRAALDILWLGLVLAVQLLAGHAQLWFYGLWLIGPYVVFRSWQSAGRRENEERGRQMANISLPFFAFSLLRFFAAIVLAILLAMLQLLPTAEFATQSARGSGAEYTFALTYSFWPWRLLTLLAPNFFGHPAQGNYWGYANYWEDHAYLGILPFLLALVAIWNYGVRRAWGERVTPAEESGTTRTWQVVPFFAALVPISLILALGWNTPIYLWVFDFVPGFGFFQAPARLLIWYTLAVAVLAGVGAQSFKLTPSSRRGWQRLLVTAGGLTIAGLVGSFILTGRSRTFLEATFTLGLWLMVSASLLLLRPRKRSTPTSTSRLALSKEAIWQGSVLLFVTFDLLWVAFPLNPTLPAAIFRQPIASADFLNRQADNYRYYVAEKFDYALKFNQYFSFAAFGPADLDYWQGLKETLIPNLGVYAGLASANNYDPLTVGRWQKLIDLVEGASATQQARLLALMNVGYFIGDSAQNIGSALYTDEAMAIQNVPEALPRAYFAPQVYHARDEAEAVTRLVSPDFDSRLEVIIMGDEVAIKALRQAQDEARSKAEEKVGTVTVVEEGPNRVLLRVEAPSPGFVVLTDTFYPGWQATVDAQPAQIWPANLAFRAVAVEAGTHEITFNYRPRSFIIGLCVSAITLALTVITLIFLIQRKRKSLPC
ncbi:MAG TPA: YfhO family protein [Anaerolineae bacterium]|nr:YfhO family protein [Anaerolineae bacterium]